MCSNGGKIHSRNPRSPSTIHILSLPFEIEIEIERERKREMSEFSIPGRPIGEIVATLAEAGIANLRPEDISNPTADVVCSLYTNFLTFVDPLGFELSPFPFFLQTLSLIPQIHAAKP